jgi:hypothetical protein
MDYNQPFGGAADSPYVNGNPAAGVQGSIPPAQAIEFPQREIVEVIRYFGMTPSNNDLTQLRKAIVAGIALAIGSGGGGGGDPDTIHLRKDTDDTSVGVIGAAGFTTPGSVIGALGNFLAATISGNASIAGAATIGSGSITGSLDVGTTLKRAGVDVVDVNRLLSGSNGILLDGFANASRNLSANRSISIDPNWVNALIAAALPAGKIIALSAGNYGAMGSATVSGGSISAVSGGVQFTFDTPRAAATYKVIGLSILQAGGSPVGTSNTSVSAVSISNKTVNGFKLAASYTPDGGDGSLGSSTSWLFLVMEN